MFRNRNMKRLRILFAVVKKPVVNLVIARMILVFALVAGAIHAPAAAHAEVASHHADRGAAAAHAELVADFGDPASSQGGTDESVQHHHCPTALGAPAHALSLSPITGKALLPAHREANLTSFSQAPPTEPPSA